MTKQIEPQGDGYVKQAAFDKIFAEVLQLRAALGKLVRKGTDDRWYTTQHGDTDVTAIVSGAVEQK